MSIIADDILGGVVKWLKVMARNPKVADLNLKLSDWRAERDTRHVDAEVKML